MISTSGLSRTYQSYKKPVGLWNSVKGFVHRQYEEKIALQPTDLQIEGAQIVGLVGANGAGKTTLLKLLSGLIYPTHGEANVLGFRPWDRDNAFLRKISILLGQKAQLWWDLPAADSYDLLASIYDLDLAKTRLRVQELAEMLMCLDQLHVQLRRLSLGERMKMEIIGSLLHNPEVLFLDEPTIGLDIVAQSTIRSFLANYVEQHKPTIILTSHYMDDISLLADRLLLISRGAIVYDGTVEQFTDRAETTQKITLRLTAPLVRTIQVHHSLELAAGMDLIDTEVPSTLVGPLLSQITQQTQIQDLKIEETDFEKVIHTFLEKESGHGQTRRPFSI